MPENALEQLLGQGDVSSEEETKEPEGNVEEVEQPAEENEPEGKSEEQPESIESRIQAGIDKASNTYREKRESDTSLIRRLREQLKEANTTNSLKKTNALVDSILAGDEEAGITPDETKTRETALKEFSELYKDYNTNSESVRETAEVISDMSKNLPENIVKEFGLDDANPSLRAANGVTFLNETLGVYSHNQDFLLTIETILPKGDELRKQLEEIVDGLAEFTTEKSKKLYLKDRLQGVKLNKKKPPSPSEVSGGEELSKLSGEELLRRGFKKELNK